jgi:predicted dehydrogenase
MVVKVGVVGLGKMGLSHLSMINAHPGAKVVAVCDASQYVLDVLGKYTGMNGFTSYDEMLKTDLDAVIVATPSRSHATLVRQALERGLHVFCEKPFCLDPADADALAALGVQKNLVTQVGYHNRFVGAFNEMKRVIDSGAIGRISHIRAEAFGPVVLRPKGSTWRTQRSEGGGCLYDYAAHPINLVNWLIGTPERATGTVLGRIFSADTEDEVYGTLLYRDGVSAQVSVNWSDESYRKMTTRITAWGTAGRIYADRQECQVYVREGTAPPEGYKTGWNVRYTTELTDPVWFYVRGEEYSSQLDYWVDAIAAGRTDNVNSFASAAMTDRTVAMMIDDSDATAAALPQVLAPRPEQPAQRRGWRAALAGLTGR